MRAYARAMLNIHPALLPAFGGKGLYGARVHCAVIASGARWSGPSVHFVDADYDTGPILAQRVVPVRPTDTPARLAARVLAQARARRLAPCVCCAQHSAAAGVTPGDPAGLPGAVPGAGLSWRLCAPPSATPHLCFCPPPSSVCGKAFQHCGTARPCLCVRSC